MVQSAKPTPATIISPLREPCAKAITAAAMTSTARTGAAANVRLSPVPKLKERPASASAELPIAWKIQDGTTNTFEGVTPLLPPSPVRPVHSHQAA